VKIQILIRNFIKLCGFNILRKEGKMKNKFFTTGKKFFKEFLVCTFQFCGGFEKHK